MKEIPHVYPPDVFPDDILQAASRAYQAGTHQAIAHAIWDERTRCKAIAAQVAFESGYTNADAGYIAAETIFNRIHRGA